MEKCMDNLIDGLLKMFFQLEIVTLSNNPNAVLVFSVGCAIVGGFAVALDIALYFLRGQSLLKLKHGKFTVLFLLAWSFGAFVIGWVGQLANIFLVSLSACVLVGFSWPLLFTKILKKASDEEAENEPEQSVGVEG